MNQPRRVSKRALLAAGAVLVAGVGGTIAYAAPAAFAPPACAAGSNPTSNTCVDRRLDAIEGWIQQHEAQPTPTVTTTVTATPTTTQPTATTAPPTTTTAPPTTTTPPVTTTTTTPSAWPDASNTGVPAGTTLTPRSGGSITTAGTVIDGANITGNIRISADNVTIRNSKITASAYWVVVVDDDATGARLENVEIDGRGDAGTDGSNGIYGTATVIKANIHGVENGFQPSSGSVIRDSWVHGLDAPGSPHIDGIQIDGSRSNILIEHNTVDMREWTQTAAVMIDNVFGAVDNVTVNNNRLLGGGYTTYIDGTFNGSTITNVRYTNNRICCGEWGYKTISGMGAGDSYVWSGNVDDITGQPIP